MEKQVNESEIVTPSDREAIGAGDVERLAALVAEGSAAVPVAWPEEAKARLAAQVGQHHRQRFVRYLARAVARDIFRSQDNARSEGEASG